MMIYETDGLIQYHRYGTNAGYKVALQVCAAVGQAKFEQLEREIGILEIIRRAPELIGMSA